MFDDAVESRKTVPPFGDCEAASAIRRVDAMPAITSTLAEVGTAADNR